MSRETKTEADAGGGAVPVQAVVADLDGTLLDTEPLYWRAYEAAVAAYGKRYSFDDVHRHIMGKPEIPGAQFVVEKTGLAAEGVTAEAFLEERDKMLLEIMPEARPRPGALELVRHFKACGLPVAVATSSYQKYIELKRRHNEDLFSLFDTVTTGDDPKIKAGKPAPDIFLAGAASIGADPARCLALEDSVAGTQSAVAAGMTTVTLPDDRLDAAQFAEAGAAHVLPSFAEFDPTLFGLPRIGDAEAIEAFAAERTARASGAVAASGGAD